jgi:hypothetical protein
MIRCIRKFQVEPVLLASGSQLGAPVVPVLPHCGSEMEQLVLVAHCVSSPSSHSGLGTWPAGATQGPPPLLPPLLEPELEPLLEPPLEPPPLDDVSAGEHAGDMGMTALNARVTPIAPSAPSESPSFDAP